MNLLLDENLSPRLVRRLASLFAGLIHVRDIGLMKAPDELIWDWAKKNRHSIITTNADFAAMTADRGWPPKVIHLEGCDQPLRVIEALLRQNAVRIAEFETDSSTGLLRLAAARGG